VLPAQPALPPREVNALVSKKAWSEPAVRVWWLMAIAALVLTIGYGIDCVYVWNQNNRLINHGILVDATIVEGNGLAIPGENVPGESPVMIDFPWKGGTQRQRGYLEGRKDYLTVGKTVPIHVSPDNPNTWTYRVDNSPLAHALLLFFPLIPIPELLLVIAIIRRKQMLKVWKTGDAAVAVVNERRQAAIAPGAYTLRCSLRDRRDRRLFIVHVRRSKSAPQKGDALWVIVPPLGQSGKPIASSWFDG